jgi:hypothetical protein
MQACDTVTWHFGDGTPDVTVTESPFVAHTYATPGSYSATATLANTLGSIQGSGTVAIAPAAATYVDFSPSQITVPETAGSITFTLVRGGDLNRTSTVHYWHPATSQAEAINGDVVFAPGETTKSIVMRVFDNHAYTGAFTGTVFATAADGTAVRANRAQYTLTETSAQPTATVDDVRVLESAGTANIVVHLSAPLGVPVVFQALPGNDFTGTPTCVLQPGEVRCAVPVSLIDDDVAGPDRTFTVKIEKRDSPVGPLFLRDTATVTIVDDDAPRIVVAEPASLALLAGAHGTVNVSLQPPNAAAQTVAISSARPEVAAVPASLTIPAGGTATLDLHALAAGTAKIWIGSSFSVDVTVAVPRRRASR